jgi:hypothetical protein
MGTAIRAGLALGCLLVTIVTAVVAHADDAVLLFTGKVPGGEVKLTLDEIAKLPQRTLTEQPTDFPKPMVFKGPALADVLALAGATGGDLSLLASDDYKSEITSDEIEAFNPILAIEKDGVRMAPDDFGPFYVMWPFKENPEIDNEKFQSKAIWQLIKVEVK